MNRHGVRRSSIPTSSASNESFSISVRFNGNSWIDRSRQPDSCWLSIGLPVQGRAGELLFDGRRKPPPRGTVDRASEGERVIWTAKHAPIFGPQRRRHPSAPALAQTVPKICPHRCAPSPESETISSVWEETRTTLGVVAARLSDASAAAEVEVLIVTVGLCSCLSRARDVGRREMAWKL